MRNGKAMHAVFVCGAPTSDLVRVLDCVRRLNLHVFSLSAIPVEPGLLVELSLGVAEVSRFETLCRRIDQIETVRDLTTRGTSGSRETSNGQQ